MCETQYFEWLCDPTIFGCPGMPGCSYAIGFPHTKLKQNYLCVCEIQVFITSFFFSLFIQGVG